MTVTGQTPLSGDGRWGFVFSETGKISTAYGINVNATVRDPSDSKKVDHLTALAKASAGQLKLFKADLLDAGSFDDPMRDCELVIHTASPFFLSPPKNPEEELIRPAKEGTRNVLQAAQRNPTVKRVVLTSSVVATFGDNADIALTPRGGVH